MIEHSELSTPVYKALRQMIEEGQLKPGEKLIQENLANQLGVSRTPLLKAMQMLEHELMVESRPRRGMYVREVSLQEMIHVYDCREALETMAVKSAVERASETEIKALAAVFTPFVAGSIDRKAYEEADEKFHDMIIDMAHNPVLKRMSSVGNVHKRVYQYGLLRPPEVTLAEHRRIVVAIQSRDADRAVEETRRHIDESRKTLIARINE